MRSDQLERRLRERLDALGTDGPSRVAEGPPVAGLRARCPVGKIWNEPEGRASAELLIDCEEDRTLRAVLVGMLRETER